MTMAKKRNFQHKLYSHLCGVCVCVEYTDYRGTYLSFFLERLSKVKQFNQNDSEQLKSMEKTETIEWELSHPQNECFLKHRKKYWTSDIIVSLFVDCSCMASTIPFIHVLVLFFLHPIFFTLHFGWTIIFNRF